MSAHPAPRATRAIRAETAGSSSLALRPNQRGKAGGEVEASIPVMAIAHQRNCKERGARRGRASDSAPAQRPGRPCCLRWQKVAKGGKKNRDGAGESGIRRAEKWLDTLPLVAGRGAA